MRPGVTLTILLAVAGLASAQVDGYDEAVRAATAVLSVEGRPVDPDEAGRARADLAAIPRPALPDREWLVLHALLLALDRAISPPPAVCGEEPPADALAALLPVPGISRPAPLLDAAAALLALRLRVGPPAAESRRAAFAALADRARAAAEGHRPSRDAPPLRRAAALVLADALADFSFDLRAVAQGFAPMGAERYEWLLRQNGSVAGAEATRRAGVRAREEALRNLRRIAAEVDPSRAWPDLVEAARDDSPRDPEDLLARCREDAAAALRATIASGLVTVPQSARHAILVPDPADSLMPFAHYRPRGPGPGGVFLGEMAVAGPPERLTPAERAEFLRERDRRFMAQVTAHELVPGHHLQFAVAAATPGSGLPFTWDTGYVEGWGLYSEELLERAGVGRDPLSRLTRARMALWRAVRVIVDVDLHTGAIRPSSAVRLLVDEVRLTRDSAEREVLRYLGSPTQAQSYTTGLLRLRALRRAYLARHGPDAERDFHDRLLALGPIPLDLAAAVMLDRRPAYDLAHP